ncbi:MAG: sugar ABC transporter permease [Chloroflexi bacterium]|nr:sugar ABC transporter permease [Chloroflexota bacterium]
MTTLATLGGGSRPSPLRRALRRPQFWFGLAVLAPVLAYYLVFAFLPFAGAAFMSVTRFNLLDIPKSPFVGLDNFQDLLAEPRFYLALKNSVVYAAVHMAGQLPLALFLAALLNEVRRLQKVYLFAIFTPVVSSLVAVGLLWRWLYEPGVGPINFILRSVGLPQQGFLSSPDQALYSIAAMEIWKGLGFYTVILLAGILNIPETYYEAARIDGASFWRCFWHITLPLLGHVLLLVSVLMAIGGLQVFTPMRVMPGPGASTLVVNVMIYEEGVQSLRMGFATALALVMFVIIFVITLVQLRLLKPTWSH